MKKLLAGILIITTSGCASMQMKPLSCQEEYALNGMVCGGQSFGQSVGMGMRYGSSATAYSFGNSRQVSCERPKTEVDNKEVEQYREPAMEKMEANSEIHTKQIVWASVIMGVCAAATIAIVAIATKPSH